MRARSLRWSSLVALALASAAGWRLEVELHGWEGLTWLGYPHLAVPASCAAFVGWAAAVAPLPARRRAALAASLSALGLALYPAMRWTLTARYATGPGAFALHLRLLDTLGEAGPLALWVAPWVALTAVVLGAAGLARAVGLPVTAPRAALALVLFHAAWPAAVLLLRVTGHPGGANAVHAVKSGFVVPLLVVGLGLPFVHEADPPGR